MQGNGTQSGQTSPSPTTTPAPAYPQQQFGVIGFIPVIFYPHCGNPQEVQQQIQPIFPSAIHVPYSCSACAAAAQGQQQQQQPQPPAQNNKRRRNIRRRIGSTA